MPDSDGGKKQSWFHRFSRRGTPNRAPNDLVVEGLAKMGEAGPSQAAAVDHLAEETSADGSTEPQ